MCFNTYKYLVLYLCTLYGVLEQDSLYAQTTVKLSGRITHAADNTLLAGVIVRVIGAENRGKVTDEKGFYCFYLSEGTYYVEVSYVGFQKPRDTIELMHS